MSVCTGGEGYKHTHITYIFSTSSKSGQCLSVLEEKATNITYIFSTSSKSGQCLSVLEEKATNIHTSPISSLLPQSQVSVCLYWRRRLQTSPISSLLPQSQVSVCLYWRRRLQTSPISSLLPQSQVSVCLYWRRLQTYTHHLYLLYFLKVRSVSVCTGGEGYKLTHITYIFSTSSKSGQCLSVLEEKVTNIHTSPISSLLPQSQVSVCLYWRRRLQTYTHHLYLLYFLKVKSVSVCTGGDDYKHTHITYIFSTSSKSSQCLSVLEEMTTNIHTSPISSLLPQSQVSVCLYWTRRLQTYTHHLYLLYFLKVRAVSVCTGGDGFKHTHITYMFLMCSDMLFLLL